MPQTGSFFNSMDGEGCGLPRCAGVLLRTRLNKLPRIDLTTRTNNSGKMKSTKKLRIMESGQRDYACPGESRYYFFFFVVFALGSL